MFLLFSMNTIYTIKKWKILRKRNYIQGNIDDLNVQQGIKNSFQYADRSCKMGLGILEKCV